ncbi:MAG: aldehyde dehydrogenase [Bacteroidales bacterium]|jgi:hypothetical protein|nr:aldehyde dehydrogenase [Bacteroidales bacterium]
MRISERIKIFSLLGQRLLAETLEPATGLLSVARRAESKFSFFTFDNIMRSLRACAEWLSEEKLREWVSAYPVVEKFSDKKIAVIMAGNLPFVGFHDVLCVLAAGYKVVIKPSSNDPYLWHYLQQLMAEVSPEMAARIEITDGILQGFDAVIATGSNNSARYFEEYFAKYPHIIRKNRSSAAVLQGGESSAQLDGLFDDMFSYFGLGCRNVSHVFLPKGYDVQGLAMRLFPEADAFGLKNHNSYCNNYQYQRAVAAMNGVKFIDTAYSLWIENDSLQAQIGVVNYSFYNDFSVLLKRLEQQCDVLQCVVGEIDCSGLPIIPFGKAQQPSLIDYADGIDTMKFLENLNISKM